MNKIWFKKIYFVWSRFGGGATMGCYQPHLVCHDMSIPSMVYGINDMPISQIKESAVFFMKGRPSQDLINRLKENKNIIVYYPGDGSEPLLMEYIKKINNLDGIIVGGNEFKKLISLQRKDIQTTVIPANHDYFLDSKIFKKERESEFKLYFGGSRNPHAPTQGDLALEQFKYTEGYFHSLKYIENNMRRATTTQRERYVIDIASKNKCPVLNELIQSKQNPTKYSCHYAVRAPWIGNYSTQWNTKTGGKVSTAAASGALDPSVRALIDEDYPYAINTETQEFKDNYEEMCREMVSKAKKTFNTKIWQNGLKIMKEVKDRTTTRKITLEYIDFFNKLYEL